MAQPRYVYAGLGNDYVQGCNGTDFVFGEDGNDTVYGLNNADILAGGNGNDAIYGGAGSDNLAGNDGVDKLWGGTEADGFNYHRGETPSSGSADTIMDWQAVDIVSTDVAGSSSNYREQAITTKNIGSARYQIERDTAFDGKVHAFLYNSADKVSFLLSDLDKNGSFETGVVLDGIGSASAMAYDHIGLLS